MLLSARTKRLSLEVAQRDAWLLQREARIASLEATISELEAMRREREASVREREKLSEIEIARREDMLRERENSWKIVPKSLTEPRLQPFFGDQFGGGFA